MSAERELLNRLVELKEQARTAAELGGLAGALAVDARELLAQPEPGDAYRAEIARSAQRIAHLETELSAARAAIGVLTQPERKPPSRPECLSFALEFLGEPEASELLGYIEALERPANAVERALQLQWSDQPPTVPGWYWYRTQSTDAPHIIEGSRDDERMEWYLGDALMYAELRGQWAGPITPPEE